MVDAHLPAARGCGRTRAMSLQQRRRGTGSGKGSGDVDLPRTVELRDRGRLPHRKRRQNRSGSGGEVGAIASGRFQNGFCLGRLPPRGSMTLYRKLRVLIFYCDSETTAEQNRFNANQEVADIRNKMGGASRGYLERDSVIAYSAEEWVDTYVLFSLPPREA